MRILFRLLRFVRSYWLYLALAYVCLLASVGFGLAVPWLMKEVIDVGLAQRQHGFLVVAALAVLVAAAGRGAFAYGLTYLSEYIGQRVAFDIRNALYDHLQRLSFRFHDTAQTGQLMSRATQDVEGVRMFISLGLLRALSFLLQLLGTSFILFFVERRLALITMAALPVVAYRAIVLARRLQPIWMGIQQATAEMGARLQENLSGIKVVKSFAREEDEIARFDACNKQLLQRSLEAGKQQAFNTPLLAFLLSLVGAAVLWYGGRQVVEGRMSLGDLVAFNAYLAMLLMPVRVLGWMVNVTTRAVSSGQRIFEILDTTSEVEDPRDGLELRRVRGHVAFRDVTFAYDAERSVLSHVSFEARPGQVIAIVGSTGSGKTTITHLVPRFYDVSSGSVSIDGVDVRRIKLSSLRRQVSVVLQDVFLFSAPVRDNIAYGRADASMEEILAAARAARIHDFILSLPQGYDTWVGERGITLSGGQRQRVAIARTLLLDPRVLILDDVTSSVDVETEREIQEALVEVMRGRTCLVIAQRLSTVQQADLILVLDGGRIAEAGTHDALLARGGTYREIYDLQFRGQEHAEGEEGKRGRGEKEAETIPLFPSSPFPLFAPEAREEPSP